MWKPLDMALLRCPVGFSEEIVAVIQMKKSQFDTENDKNHKTLHFSKFLRNFRQIFDRLRGSTRKKSGCPEVFSEEYIAFFTMKMSQIDTEKAKVPNFLNFKKFYAFIPNFGRNLWIGTLKIVQQGENVLLSRLPRRVYCSFLQENDSN